MERSTVLNVIAAALDAGEREYITGSVQSATHTMLSCPIHNLFMIHTPLGVGVGTMVEWV
jgi:hypothetical protein